MNRRSGPPLQSQRRSACTSCQSSGASRPYVRELGTLRPRLQEQNESIGTTVIETISEMRKEDGDVQSRGRRRADPRAFKK